MSASKNNLSQLTNKGCLNPITNLSLLLDLARADFTRLTPTEATRVGVRRPKSGLFFKTKGGNCCKSNIVYAAECTKHNQLCIGFSMRELHLRFNNHRSEINYGKIICGLVKHFHDNGCDFRKDLRVYILEDSLPLSKTSCELGEDHWILKLKTTERFGINSYVNSLAKSFYELF